MAADGDSGCLYRRQSPELRNPKPLTPTHTHIHPSATYKIFSAQLCQRTIFSADQLLTPPFPFPLLAKTLLREGINVIRTTRWPSGLDYVARGRARAEELSTSVNQRLSTSGAKKWYA